MAEFDISTYDTSNAYTEYLLTDLLLTKYNEEGDFKSVITSNERYKVPYITVDGEKGVIIYVNENGNLELSSQILVGETEHICISTSELSEIISQQLNEEVTNVIITYSNMYYMTLVYVETEKGTYIIPYMNQGLTGMENGKVYSEEVFFENMNKLFDESRLEDCSDGNGGFPYRKSKMNLFSEWGMILALLLIGISIFEMKILNRKMK